MLSPYKLYKHDVQNQHKAKVTWGPKGKPGAGCSGSACYRHYNVDWTVHRLAPTVYERAKPHGKTRAVMGKAMHSERIGMTKKNIRRAPSHLRETSPRWGDGIAPGRRSRNVVPHPHDTEISKTTYKVVGGAAVAAGAAYGGHKVYRHYHPKNQSPRTQHMDEGFHASRKQHTMGGGR